MQQSEKPKVGLTASTFDLFHAGHIVMLKEAKSLCDYLVVGLLVESTPIIGKLMVVGAQTLGIFPGSKV